MRKLIKIGLGLSALLISPVVFSQLMIHRVPLNATSVQVYDAQRGERSGAGLLGGSRGATALAPTRTYNFAEGPGYVAAGSDERGVTSNRPVGVGGKPIQPLTLDFTGPGFMCFGDDRCTPLLRNATAAEAFFERDGWIDQLGSRPTAPLQRDQPFGPR